MMNKLKDLADIQGYMQQLLHPLYSYQVGASENTNFIRINIADLNYLVKYAEKASIALWKIEEEIKASIKE